jgi:hypothetical protein
MINLEKDEKKYITIKVLREQYQYLEVLSATKAVQRSMGINNTAMAIRQAIADKVSDMEQLIGLKQHVEYKGRKYYPEIQCINCGSNKAQHPLCPVHDCQWVTIDLANMGVQRISELKGLEHMDGLQYLDLSGNELTSLTGLERLKNLEFLWLSNNKITGMKGLNGLPNLRSLVLSENKLSKIEGLDRLVNLESLFLANNDIKVIEGLDSCVSLSRLDLSVNGLQRIAGLDSLTQLSELYLQDNQIGAISGLGTLKKLSQIYLQGNPVFGWAKTEFGGTDETNEQHNYMPDNFLFPQRLVDYSKQHA